jgi:hypothetical protein
MQPATVASWARPMVPAKSAPPLGRPQSAVAAVFGGDMAKHICHTALLVICDLVVTHHPPSTISKLMRATCGLVFDTTFSQFFFIPMT